jgi:hypothetical protein
VTRSPSFTRAELRELHRALRLIIQEDENAEVNVDARSRRAKASAFAKLAAMFGSEAKESGTEEYIDVVDLAFPGRFLKRKKPE